MVELREHAKVDQMEKRKVENLEKKLVGASVE
jgi:hypothetical protein